MLLDLTRIADGCFYSHIEPLIKQSPGQDDDEELPFGRCNSVFYTLDETCTFIIFSHVRRSDRR